MSVTDPGRGTDASAEALRRSGAYRQIFQKARACAVPRVDDVSPESIAKVRRARTAYYVLSTGERVAVALVLNRPDWLKEEHWTVLEAVGRLGDTWLQAAVLVHRDGWDESEKVWQPHWILELPE